MISIILIYNVDALYFENSLFIVLLVIIRLKITYKLTVSRLRGGGVIGERKEVGADRTFR